jgi:16S rRNA (cytosine967-C5)-methyltransferase
VAPDAGDTVLDACAAPGGKMAYLAELGAGQTKLVACDASPQRLEKVHQNIQRLKLKNIEVAVKDAARDPLPEAHRILLDVPCSGTGVLNRRPDARWKRQADDLTSLVDIQRRILLNCWSNLIPGGLLVYATCTLEPEENWGVIDSVLPELPDAEIEPVSGTRYKGFIDERGALATLPWQHDMDGMFAVKIRKKI